MQLQNGFDPIVPWLRLVGLLCHVTQAISHLSQSESQAMLCRQMMSAIVFKDGVKIPPCHEPAPKQTFSNFSERIQDSQCV